LISQVLVVRVPLPVGLLMTAVFHFIPDADSLSDIIGRFLGAVPSGSYLAMSHYAEDGHTEQKRELTSQGKAAYNRRPRWCRAAWFRSDPREHSPPFFASLALLVSPVSIMRRAAGSTAEVEPAKAVEHLGKPFDLLSPDDGHWLAVGQELIGALVAARHARRAVAVAVADRLSGHGPYTGNTGRTESLLTVHCGAWDGLTNCANALRTPLPFRICRTASARACWLSGPSRPPRTRTSTSVVSLRWRHWTPRADPRITRGGDRPLGARRDRAEPRAARAGTGALSSSSRTRWCFVLRRGDHDVAVARQVRRQRPQVHGRKKFRRGVPGDRPAHRPGP
jgi:hypothetical protein